MAALYYLLHSTFAAAGLFLLADLVVRRRASGDVLRAAPPIVQNGLFAALFFAAAIGMAGMPPLSGFLGKLLVLETVWEMPHSAWAWVAVLGGSLLTIVGFVKAGSSLFWKSTAMAPLPVTQVRAAHLVHAGPLALAPTVAAVAMLALLSAFAHPVSGYLEATAAQLFEPDAYIATVPAGKGG